MHTYIFHGDGHLGSIEASWASTAVVFGLHSQHVGCLGLVVHLGRVLDHDLAAGCDVERLLAAAVVVGVAVDDGERDGLGHILITGAQHLAHQRSGRAVLRDYARRIVQHGRVVVVEDGHHGVRGGGVAR